MLLPLPEFVSSPSDQAAVLDAFESSPLARELLGPDIMENVSAVRRHESGTYSSSTAEELTLAFRFAWSA